MFASNLSRLRAVALAAVGVGVSVTGSASAQVVPVELTWNAPLECPTRASVLSRVGELVGSAAEHAPAVRAEGDITRVGNAFELRLRTEQEGQRGERLVRSLRCDDLRGVAAVALTLLLTGGTPPDALPATTPGSTEPPGPPAEGPSSAPAPVTTPEPEPEPEPTAPASRRSWRFLVSAPQLALHFGPLPKPAPALSVGLGIEGAWWSVRVLGQWADEQRLPAPVEGYGALVQRATVAVWTCAELRAGFLSLAPCLQAAGGRLRATGYGPFLVPSSRATATWAVGGGAIARARVASFLAIALALGGQVELRRPELRLDGSEFDDTVGPVGRLAPVSAALVVGPEWIF